MEEVRGLADVVAQRREFLAALADRPRSKPDLVAATDTSRSTVDRAISDLSERGLVARDGNVYRPTYAGTRVLSIHEGYLGRLADVDRASDVLSDLPPDADLDPALLDGADVRTAEPHAQEYPIRPVVDVVADAQCLGAVVPVVTPQYVDAIRAACEGAATGGSEPSERASGSERSERPASHAADRGVDVDLVVTPAVAETLQRRHAESIRICREAGLTLYETEAAPPYALWAADTGTETCAGAVVHSETGVTGAVLNDADAAHEWARETVERYRASATELDL
ncbi:helix-turn-helix transcriptional regulator [Halomicrobium salinisoli]|uniref:helix-turn-helix transcriptional regulator n=1 Tax=Halomicrobium salinisoli TaxID=2878391 RepID=UPI001CF0301A|nr:helix-turn-helix domain-containing protein [Halomicrobium salinisoli]